MAFQITTAIDFDATPDKIWDTLTDFANYPLWSDFIQNIEGSPVVGNTLKVTLPGMTFKPRVLTSEPEKHFSWLGHLLFKGLFDGEHRFILSALPTGGTRLEHTEEFSGILAGLFRRKLDTSVRDNFIMFNIALKKAVEDKISKA